MGYHMPWLRGVLAATLVVAGAAHALGQETKSARGFIEPPYLADKVASGALPSIDDRLPEQPFVVGTGTLLPAEVLQWEDGQYGGTINSGATFPTGFLNIAGGATILRSPSQSTEASLPNVVSAFSYSDDYTSFSFTLRKGLKWSDGQPVTTEDVRFTFEDIYADPDVNRPLPSELYTDGDPSLPPAKLTVVDEQTFKLEFAKPYGFFVAALNSWIPYYDFILKPSHYLKQFHAKYADPAALAKLVADNKQANWVQLLAYKDVVHWDIGAEKALGMPVLNAWVLTAVNETQRVYERNPFFWHVDSSGRQLPYADKLVNTIYTDTSALTNAVLAGQVTIASGGEVALSNMPIYLQNADRNGTRVFTSGSFNSPVQLFINYDYGFDDPNSVWQKLVNDPDRRLAKSFVAAIDPESINQAVFFGQYGSASTEYAYNSPEAANKLLDELGLDKRGDDGMRLGPDGKPFILRLTHASASPEINPIAELLVQQFAAVGLKMTIERTDNGLFEQRKAANEIQLSLMWNDGPSWAGGISRDYQPTSKGPWSPLTWLYGTSKGSNGREPDDIMKQFYDIDSQRQQFPPQSAEGQKVFADLQKWFVDYLPFIPTTGQRVAVNVVDKRLRNVPGDGAPVELDTYINAEGVWFGN